jgi:Rieske Fe-S protein
MRKIHHIIGILLFLLLPGIIAPSCESNQGQIIPYVKVDKYLDINAELAGMGIGTSKLIPGEGVTGIVLYRESDLEFYAYDRTCTLWPEHTAAVVEDTAFFGVFRCPECESTYLLMNGAEPNSGPARYPLVEYNAVIAGYMLHIYN